jgi:hypothetical protein
MPTALHDGLQHLLAPLSWDLRADRWQTRRRLPQFTEMKQLFADKVIRVFRQIDSVRNLKTVEP